MKKIMNVISIIVMVVLLTISQELMLAAIAIPASKIERIQDYPKLEEQIKKHFLVTDPVAIYKMIRNFSEVK